MNIFKFFSLLIAVTVKFVFENTSSIKKRLCTPSGCDYSDYVVCFLNGMLADLVLAIDCFGKLAVTVALPLAVRQADLENCLAGRIFGLLVVRFVTLWLPKTLNLSTRKKTALTSEHLPTFSLTFSCLVAYTSTPIPLYHLHSKIITDNVTLILHDIR